LDKGSSEARVGWIGLGAMGGAMARAVARAGFPLTAHDKRDEAVAPLVAEGAKAATSAAAVAEQADIVFVCLASEAASLSVAEEVFAAGRPGIYVEHSTLTPDAMQRLAAMADAAGWRFLDAPVSGSKQARDAGQLSVMIGGDEAAAERIRPIVQCYGSKIFHLGAVGTGSVAKLAHNLIALTSVMAIIEGLLLGVKQGIPMDRLRDAVMAGAAGNPVVAHVANLYISRAYRDPASAEAVMRLAIKDLQQAKQLAERSGLKVATATSALDSWQEAVDAGLGDHEIWAMLDHLEGGAAA
jgi:3-hydroxyisobutyrate dehydrogenase